MLAAVKPLRSELKKLVRSRPETRAVGVPLN